MYIFVCILFSNFILKPSSSTHTTSLKDNFHIKKTNNRAEEKKLHSDLFVNLHIHTRTLLCIFFFHLLWDETYICNVNMRKVWKEVNPLKYHECIWFYTLSHMHKRKFPCHINIQFFFQIFCILNNVLNTTGNWIIEGNSFHFLPPVIALIW